MAQLTALLTAVLAFARAFGHRVASLRWRGHLFFWGGLISAGVVLLNDPRAISAASQPANLSIPDIPNWVFALTTALGAVIQTIDLRKDAGGK